VGCHNHEGDLNTEVNVHEHSKTTRIISEKVFFARLIRIRSGSGGVERHCVDSVKESIHSRRIHWRKATISQRIQTHQKYWRWWRKLT
jgi:hypothetical protein